MNKVIEKKLDLAMGHISEAHTGLEILRDDMQNDFEEKSEQWQDSEKGEAMKEKIELLDDLVSRLDDIDNELNDLKTKE